jgi:hypothetical protein
MMKINVQCRRLISPARIYTLCVFALLILFASSGRGQAQQWSNNGSDIHNTNSGNVGIGTTSPSRKLTVQDAAASTLISVTNTNSATVSAFIQTNAAGFGAVGTETNHPLYFATNNDTKLAVLANGNVGIGTLSPTTKLHVAGDVTVTGNISAKYQDVAEWVPARQAMKAGTVVSLDTEKSNQVMSSTQAYDTRVAGVVSAQPGITLGERGSGKVLVATTGRVKVRVDATRAPIRIGDLLVTSDKEGMAMKSVPTIINGKPFHSPGTLIGKALEPLEKGTGEILVLLSLQ